MNTLKLTFEVARWEFLRYFKLRQQIVSLVLMMAGGVVGFGGIQLLNASAQARVTVAVTGSEALIFNMPPDSRIELRAHGGDDEAGLRERIGRKELDGLLILHDSDRAELVVASKPSWLAELSAALDAARRERRLADAGLQPVQLQAILAPVAIDVSYLDPANGPASPVEIWSVVALIGLMLLGVFVGNAYLFTGITGEKQQRVTEQVVAAISAQTWIDGKILGLSAVSFALVAVYGIGLLGLLAALGWLGAAVSTPFAVLDLARIAVYLVLALLGFLFWFAFFAAIAATINDPNNSARSSFLFLPLLPISFAFAALKNPDAVPVRILGLLPPTSPAVLPARMILGEVAVWEVVVAFVVLIASIWFLRLAAGRIFELGILTFGKEPTWTEMWRWLRRTQA